MKSPLVPNFAAESCFNLLKRVFEGRPQFTYDIIGFAPMIGKQGCQNHSAKGANEASAANLGRNSLRKCGSAPEMAVWSRFSAFR